MKRILENKNIVLTRTAQQSKEAIVLLEDLGANVINFPTIKISPISNFIVNETIANITSFNSIIFTSENAVKYFLLKVNELKVKFAPEKFHIISIGKKTSDLCKQNNMQINFQPNRFSWNYLVEELQNTDLSDKNIFVPCSNLADKKKYKQLEKFGAKITAVSIYKNEINDAEYLSDKIALLNKTNIDIYIFSSPSTFNGFVKILNIKNAVEYFSNKNIAVIGPVTEKALNKVGVYPNIIPDNFSMPDVVKVIENFFNQKDRTTV